MPPLAELDWVSTFEDLDPEPNVLEFELVASRTQAELKLGEISDVMAYNGSTPGPLLHARVGDRVIVHFTNELDEPTTVHWHGLRIADAMDGKPRVDDPVPAGGSTTFDFELPEAGNFWYHPHASVIQLAHGLYGPIVVAEKDAPVFNAERLLVIDDVLLENGKLGVPGTHHHDTVHGLGGNLLMTNGKTHPASGTSSPGAIERWRLLNSANATFQEVSVTNATWKVIGTDGGLLPASAAYSTDRLVIAPGQRFDLEVRMGTESGAVARLLAHVIPGVDPGSDATQPLAEYVIGGQDAPVAEPIYPDVELPPIVEGEQHELTLSGYLTPSDDVVFTINDSPGSEADVLMVQQGAPVRIKLINEIGPHAFHLQGQFFQVASRNGQPVTEPGLMDTVLVEAQSEVEIFSTMDNPGSWLYFCNVPAHAEHGMLAGVTVKPAD